MGMGLAQQPIMPMGSVPAPQAPSSTSNPWVITAEERQGYEKQFYTIGPVKGKITGNQAVTFFTKTGLPKPTLGQVWNFADQDNDGSLTFEEFAVAMHLINMKLKGTDLPTTLPETLKTLGAGVWTMQHVCMVGD